MRISKQLRQLSLRKILVQSAVVLLWVGGLGAQPVTNLVDPSEQVKSDPIAYHYTLQKAAQAIAHGHFDQARDSLSIISSPSVDDRFAGQLQEILGYHYDLADKLQKARGEAYQEHLDKMVQAVQAAHWRARMLEASESFSLENEEKTEEEDNLREKGQEQWLKALIQLSASHNLAHRVGVTETVDEAVRQEIIRESLLIARQMEQEHKWLEAYGKVYYPLLSLDKQNEEYEQAGERLLRQAILVETYVPDPNQVVISWQDRRKGVSFDIVREALKYADARYVEKPDFREMTVKALWNCQMLAQTPKLSETFEQLNDKDMTNAYIEKLDLLVLEAERESTDFYNYKQVLDFLRQAQKINKQTLEFPEEVIIGEFTDGAFASLDGYTYIAWPSDVATFRKEMTNKFSGVGVYIQKKDGLLTIESLLDDSPAEQAGLDAGDVIAKIDGKKTTNMSMDMAVRQITGESGTDVVLTIDRAGFDKPRDFTVTRGRIVVRTVKGISRDAQGQWQYFLDSKEGIAYVNLTNFAEETTGRMNKLLRELQGRKMRALVLDLRNNSGGFLSTAVEVVDSFIDKGVIVSSKSRGETEALADVATRAGTFDARLPMVVLVNVASASASEIVSGALKDHGRALIVGTRTYGKGSVQTIRKLWPSDAEMKMTIAYYYLPHGRRVHRDPKDKTNEDYGVAPDVKVELTGSQITEWQKVTRAASVLRRNGQAKNRKVYTMNEIIESDPQLKVALLCLKGSLMAKSLGADDEVELVGPVREK